MTITIFITCVILSTVWSKQVRFSKNFTSIVSHRDLVKKTVPFTDKLDFHPVFRNESIVRNGVKNTSHNSSDILLKRTMNYGVVKNGANFALHNLKPLRLKTASSTARSRLAMLHSSTFKPIHIYGSVPFKTFLTALSKSNGQSFNPSLQPNTHVIRQTSLRPLPGVKPLQGRHFLTPGVNNIRMMQQETVPLFQGRAPPISLPAQLVGGPLQGDLPAFSSPQFNMAGYFPYPYVVYPNHPIIHHFGHRKGSNNFVCSILRKNSLRTIYLIPRFQDSVLSK